MTEDKVHALNFDVPETLWQTIRTEADRQGIAVASLVKVILTRHFDELIEKK